MDDIREPAVAGTFYPDNRYELAAMLKSLLAMAKATEIGQRPIAIIAPHAGYIYSGAIAGKAYQTIANYAAAISRVILLGPAHRVPVVGIAAPSCQYFKTPLGRVELDCERLATMCQQPYVNYNDEAHSQEHSLEVQLPFLQQLLPTLKVAPLVIGDCPATAIAALLEPYWSLADTLLVISSDLSHFHQYDEAQRLDLNTSKLIETCDYQQIGPEQACGYAPIRGLLHLAKQHQWQVNTIAQANSGDTAGDKERVVGYGAYCVQHNTN